MKENKISFEDAVALLNSDESHFLDFKEKDIKGRSLQKIISAFANADSGEVFIGIKDKKTPVNDIIEQWSGFLNQEEANQLIQTINLEIKPPPPLQLEFYTVDGYEKKGKVLKIFILKSSEVHYTSDGKVYLRAGAQSLPINDEQITNLKLSKGLISYEDQMISGYSDQELADEEELKFFLNLYSPKMAPFEFLKKQRLIRKEDDTYKPTLAGVLLFSDNPSAIISKKCAIKISRYDTSDIEPLRENLREQYTLEGPIRKQIEEALKLIKETIELVPILGEKGLEKPKYPIEAIKEILVNALIHRDYNISDDILVFVYNNRIEIKNPGRLPGHITLDNILEERFARNPTIVRILNKYPDPPNKDIGEGLNTAFQRMQEMRLKPPKIIAYDNAVVVTLPHEPLASPEDTILEYLSTHESINNRTARKLCGIRSENSMKDVFYRLRDRNLIERVPGKEGPASCWRKKRKLRKIVTCQRG